MRITYSKEVDILYVNLTPPVGNLATVENEHGDLLRVDTANGRVVGVAIQLFLHRITLGEKIEVPEIGFALDTSSGKAVSEIAYAQTH
jgi:uncharacterized protein YuzE